MKLKNIINEAKFKAPEEIITSISSSEIPSLYMAKADVGLGLAMGGELGRGLALTNSDYSLRYSNGKIALKLTPKGKLAVRIRSEKIPNYLDMIKKFADSYLIEYSKKIKKRLALPKQSSNKFEIGKVHSNPFHRAFKPIEEEEDHEVSMAQGLLDDIIKNATELKEKIGESEKDIPAWIQDHISKSQSYIDQANTNYHEIP